MSTIVMQPGTIVRYRASNGAIRPGILVEEVVPNLIWTLVYFNNKGMPLFAPTAENDQTQSVNNTFAVISFQVPF